jgi:2'-5' RNA ligase
MTKQTMRDHWWWRPGWRLGRRMYTWHITFDGQDQLHALVDAYQERLASLPGLDPIPRPWLHLTTQGLGFVDETPRADVERVIEAARERLVTLRRPTVNVGPALVDPEVVRLKVQPAEDVAPIRRALREAIITARGADLLMETDDWQPHVNVAYSNASGPMVPIAAALEPELEPVPLTVSEVQLSCRVGTTSCTNGKHVRHCLSARLTQWAVAIFATGRRLKPGRDARAQFNESRSLSI